MHIPHDPKVDGQEPPSGACRTSCRHLSQLIVWSALRVSSAGVIGTPLAAQLDRPVLRLPEDWNVGGTRSDDYEMGFDPAESCAVIRYRVALAEPTLGHASSGFGTLMQNFRAEGFLNKRLELSAQLKASAVTGAGSLWMRVDGEKGRTLAFDNLDGRKSKGAARWHHRLAG